MNGVTFYKITNKINGKKYIGQSMKPEIRWKEHKARLRAGVHTSKKMTFDFDTYGLEAFEFEILEKTNFTMHGDIRKRESELMDLYDTRKNGCDHAGDTFDGNNGDETFDIVGSHTVTLKGELHIALMYYLKTEEKTKSIFIKEAIKEKLEKEGIDLEGIKEEDWLELHD